MDEEGQTGAIAEARLDLPGGAIVQNSIFVVAYYDHEGNCRYGFRFSGESSLAQGLGILEIVKAHMIGEADR